MKIESWPISKLIKLEAPFNFTFGPIPQILFDSIKKIGITHPPQILQTRGGETILISGKRRIQILYQIDKNKTLPVKIYSPKEISSLEAFDLAFFENLSVRKLNAIEKSNALKILTQELKVPLKVIHKEYLPHLELPLKEETIFQYLKLQELDPSAKELVSKGVLQVDTALKLLKFEAKDRPLILNIIRALHLGANSQKIFINLVWEIFKKNGTPFSQLAHQEAIKKILKEEKWTASQKWARLEGELKRQRFPLLSQLETKFKDIKSQLKLPPTLSLQNPPYFETSDYSVQFRFKNSEEYASHLRILKSIVSNKALHELFKLTGENGNPLPS